MYMTLTLLGALLPVCQFCRSTFYLIKKKSSLVLMSSQRVQAWNSYTGRAPFYINGNHIWVKTATFGSKRGLHFQPTPNPQFWRFSAWWEMYSIFFGKWHFLIRAQVTPSQMLRIFSLVHTMEMSSSWFSVICRLCSTVILVRNEVQCFWIMLMSTMNTNLQLLLKLISKRSNNFRNTMETCLGLFNRIVPTGKE